MNWSDPIVPLINRKSQELHSNSNEQYKGQYPDKNMTLLNVLRWRSFISQTFSSYSADLADKNYEFNQNVMALKDIKYESLVTLETYQPIVRFIGMYRMFALL